jgi:hypothetical protein
MSFNTVGLSATIVTFGELLSWVDNFMIKAIHISNGFPFEKYNLENQVSPKAWI